jgi:drug/metabolite transporter (DMT)-like permease
MKPQSPYALGIIAVLSYVLICAAREVYLSGVLKSANIYLTLLILFSITAGAFLLITRKSGSLPQAMARNRGLVIGVNATTIVMWVSFMVSLKHIAPAATAAICAGTVPLATLAYLVTKRGARHVPPATWVSSVGIALCIAVIATAAMKDSAPLGVACAALSGVFTALNNILLKKLSERKLNSARIMSVRFFGLILVAAVGTAATWDQAQWLQTSLPPLIVTGLLGVIAPLYLLQLGIARIAVADTALILATGPIATLALQTIAGVKPATPTTLAATVGSCFFIAIELKWRRGMAIS